MADEQRQQLRQAYDLIKDGKKKEAGRILLDVLRADRDNADAWWLLANAATDPEKTRQALGQVLRINPTDRRARDMLSRLDDQTFIGGAPSSTPSSTPAFADLGDSFGDSLGPSSPQGNVFADPNVTIPPSPRSPSTPSAPPSASASSSAASSAFFDNNPYAEADERSKQRSQPSTPPPASSSPDPFGDPFGSEPTIMGSAPAASDPFGDPFATAPQPSYSASNDPFGDPFATSATPHRPAQDDPFADPFASGSPAGSRAYGGSPPPMQVAPAPQIVVQKKGRNPLVVILAIFGGCALIVCIGIFLLSAGILTLGGVAINQALQDPTFQAAINDPTFQAFIQNPGAVLNDPTLQAALNDPTLQAFFQNPGAVLNDPTLQAALNDPTLQAAFEEFGIDINNQPDGPSSTQAAINLTTTPIASSIIGTVVPKTTINPGQPIQDTLPDDGFTNHSYTFSGSQGSKITIELRAVDNEFDTKLTLLGTDGTTTVAFNDDINSDNLNSRIEFVIPSNGTYTIIVGDVGFDGGAYELTLTQQ